MTPEERAKAIADLLVAAIREAVAEERQACAMLAYTYPAPDPGGSWRESIGAAIMHRKDAP